MKLTIPRLQQFYDQLKRSMEDCTIIIAGGAVRDALNGREVKDLDVYIQCGLDWDKDPCDVAEEVESVIFTWNKQFFSKGKCLSEEIVDGGQGAYKGISIQTVWHWDHACGDLPLDLIFVNRDPSTVVKQEFDFGICQAWVGHYGLKTHPAYWTDSLNRTITYLRPTASASLRVKSQEHAGRILTKYPGWKCRGITPINPT